MKELFFFCCWKNKHCEGVTLLLLTHSSSSLPSYMCKASSLHNTIFANRQTTRPKGSGITFIIVWHTTQNNMNTCVESHAGSLFQRPVLHEKPQD